MKMFIIWDINEDTIVLIDELREKEAGMITIIEKDRQNGLTKRGDLTYASKDYVESIKDLGFQIIHYHYIPPLQQTDHQKWHEFREGGIVH